MTAGPWRPIALETYHSRVDDLWIDYKLAKDLRSVQGTLYARVSGHQSDVLFTLALRDETVVKVKASSQGDGLLSAEFHVGE